MAGTTFPYLLTETIHHKIENHSLTKLLDNNSFHVKVPQQRDLGGASELLSS
jgi:hypothetical protein